MHEVILKLFRHIVCMAQNKISVTITSFNLEDRIQKCLDSVVGVGDEIIVVDSYSTDRTKEICLKYPIKFIEQEFLGYVEQKNFAITHAENEWILHLDGDEALDDNLREQILKLKENFDQDAYSFNRCTNYAGHWVRHCGWYPDVKVRLFKKSMGQWGGDNPHDIIILKEGSKRKHISGDLLHYSYNSVTDHISQTNRFTTIAAPAVYAKGVRSSWFKIVTRPPLKFFRDYFFKAGFLDGKYGLIICVINALSAFLK